MKVHQELSYVYLCTLTYVQPSTYSCVMLPQFAQHGDTEQLYNWKTSIIVSIQK